jgi:hypothetical protein
LFWLSRPSRQLPAKHPNLRGGTHTVSVYASVVDASGTACHGLTKDDFIVLDDGKPQDVSVFTNDEQPITTRRRCSTQRQRDAAIHACARDAASSSSLNLAEPIARGIGSFSSAVCASIPSVFTNDKDELVRIPYTTNCWDHGPNAAVERDVFGHDGPPRRSRSARRVVFTDGYDNPMTSGMRVGPR